MKNINELGVSLIGEEIKENGKKEIKFVIELSDEQAKKLADKIKELSLEEALKGMRKF